MLLRWPVGTPATGNEGVADAIAKKKNSIGYVEFVQAERAGLSHVATQNRAGRFVSPAPAAFAAAAANAEWKAANDFRVLLSDAPGEEAYPLAATVFILIVQRNPVLTRVQLYLLNASEEWWTGGIHADRKHP